MTRLEELIKELCPNGVRFFSIENLIKQSYVYTITPSIKIKRSDYLQVGNTPIISQEEEYISGYCNFVDGNIPLANYVCFGDHSEHIKYINFSFVQGADGLKIMTTNSTKINPRYFYHACSSYYVRRNNYERHFKYFCDTIIPVPPLPVQEEIVRILDSFTELTAELTARKKQYEYYRDSLLTISNEKLAMSRLDSIAKSTYGYTDKAKDSGSVRFIRITDISDNGTLNPNDAKFIDLTDESKKYLLHKGDIVMARTGATFGKTLYVPDDTPSVYASFLIKITLDNSKISNRFYWHFAQSNLYWEQANKLVSAGGQPQFNASAVGRVLVPVPPLEAQNKIVQVLDNFDSICSDLKIGLPAEIEARQKQYEYYRDKIMAF